MLTILSDKHAIKMAQNTLAAVFADAATTRCRTATEDPTGRSDQQDLMHRHTPPAQFGTSSPQALPFDAGGAVVR